MTVREAVEYLENYPVRDSRPGLERIRVLMNRLRNPQHGMKYVHVTGSNGKGSTCALVESVLREAGYRTGLYTSPHLEQYMERIRVSGKMGGGRPFSKAVKLVKAAAETMEDCPTWFEITTAVALLYFRLCGCDIIVLEVGMGGEFDATNVIDAPEVAALVNIGLEHTGILGKTVHDIALTKAGIIKEGCDAVCYDSCPEAVDVVRSVCERKHVPLTVTDFSRLEILREQLSGQTFRYGSRELKLKFLGRHQARNAATALEILDALRRRGWTIGEEAVRKGFRTAKWPARFEVLSQDPLFILDGGHNPQCAEALADTVRTFLPEQKPVFLTGTLADKDYARITDIIGPLGEKFICLTPVSERALGAEQYAEYLREKGYSATEFSQIRDGIHAALNAGRGKAVVAFGSLYLAGAVRSAYKNVLRDWLRRDRMAKRKQISEETRKECSEGIVRNILNSGITEEARTVMVYRAISGEADLSRLETELMGKGVRIVYPVCVSGSEMTARIPLASDAWIRGKFGISEPDPEQSEEISPEEIDLIFCPCTVFDRQCNRMGRGSGFYDRYLTRCSNAKVVSVAYEIQKTDAVPVEKWDLPTEYVITERTVYVNSRKQSGKV